MDESWSQPDIVRGLQNGNSDAWAALCSLYSERLWKYVARLIGSNEAAVADVFQETLLAVAKAGRSLNDHSKLWAWLSAIGHNQCALYWRNHARQRTELLAEESALTEPDDVLLRLETIASVRILLSDISADYVIVLTAKYVEGISIIDIAEQLEESVEAVRSRLARARKEFRQRYEAMTETAKT